MKKLSAIIAIYVMLFALCGPDAYAQYVTTAFTKSGGVAKTVVSTCANGSFGTSTSCTFGSNITNGNVLVAFAYGASGLTLPANPSGCVTWTNKGTGSVGSSSQSVSVGPITSTAACTVTETASGSSANIQLMIFQVNTTTTVDGTPGFNYDISGCTTTCNGASTTTSVNGDLVLSFIFTGGSHTFTATSPFSMDCTAGCFSGFYGGMSHDVQGSSGSITPQWGVDSGTPWWGGTIALE